MSQVQVQTVIKRYLSKFDEINRLFGFDEEDVSHKRADDFADFLIDAYIEGFSGASYLLGEDVDIDKEKMAKAVNQAYNGVSIFDKFMDYVQNGNEGALQTLIESEFHRAYNVGAYDRASFSGNLKKQWKTVGDDRVRDTHAYLESVSVPYNDYFVTNDGDKALYPGGFAKANNNANCRCIVVYSV